METAGFQNAANHHLLETLTDGEGTTVEWLLNDSRSAMTWSGGSLTHVSTSPDVAPVSASRGATTHNRCDRQVAARASINCGVTRLANLSVRLLNTLSATPSTRQL